MTKTPLEVYRDIAIPAWTAYVKSTDQARETCKEAKAQAFAAYEKVQMPAWEAYMEARTQ